MSEDMYYSKEVYVCRSCRREWDTPGSAEICYRKDRVMELCAEIDGLSTHHELEEVIELLEEYVEDQGENDE